MMLEKLGYSVDVATSGSEAIKKYTEKRTDIVILDMIMPDMSGGEVFDRLKAVHTDVRVVLSSGYSLSGQTQEVFDRGCQGFIQKPFTLDALSEKIQMVMHKA
jgi:CheY-like chemotaxis protein